MSTSSAGLPRWQQHFIEHLDRGRTRWSPPRRAPSAGCTRRPCRRSSATTPSHRPPRPTRRRPPPRTSRALTPSSSRSTRPPSSTSSWLQTTSTSRDCSTLLALAELRQGQMGHGPPSSAAFSHNIASPWVVECQLVVIPCSLAHSARPAFFGKLRHSVSSTNFTHSCCQRCCFRFCLIFCYEVTIFEIRDCEYCCGVTDWMQSLQFPGKECCKHRIFFKHQP